MRSLRNVHLVNVQFAAAAHALDGITTLPVLTRDSIAVTGRHGPRKPLVPDIFDALWKEAQRLGAPYFLFANADIHVSQGAVDWVARGDHDAFVLAREDFDGTTGQPRRVNIYGADAFAVATAWWAAHRRRFRGYILGEAVWDNVYAAILLCHAATALDNRRALVRHEAHEQTWTTDGPFADYQRLLAARDATYFSMWCEYVDALIAARGRGASALEEDELLRRTFRWPPPARARLWQALRSAKAFVRYSVRRD